MKFFDLEKMLEVGIVCYLARGCLKSSCSGKCTIAKTEKKL